MNADEITKAIENRIAEIDAQAAELLEERARLTAMLAREETPTRVERFGEIVLPPMRPGINFQPALPYLPPHLPFAKGCDVVVASQLNDASALFPADRNAS